MGIRKWLMKQYWRLVQVRGLWNLFYGVLLLSIAYYVYFPFFFDMGAWGPLVLAGTLLFTFLIIGYLYDRVFVMWGPQQEVVIERNPFQYVPQPRDKIFWFPIYSSLLTASEQIANEMNIDTSVIQEVREYFTELEKLRPERTQDIDTAIKLREEFLRKYRFQDIIDDE